MKITEVKVWLVEGIKYNWTLLKIHTDTGHTGVGESTNWPGSPIIEAAHGAESVTRVMALAHAQRHARLHPLTDGAQGVCVLQADRLLVPRHAYGVPIAPHNPNGPLSTLASAHVCAGIPNFFRCEFMFNDVP